MKTTRSYLVQSVIAAAEVLRAFGSGEEVLRLRDIVERTGFNRSLCFRLLHTLQHCGLLERIDRGWYRSIPDLHRPVRYRIGYTAAGHDSAFQRAVRDSLICAARAADIELIVLDSRTSAKIALRNAEHLVREQVDLVIAFQVDEAIAAVIASRYLQASIPWVAVHVPHPGATYYGANNYQAGLMAGQCLARWAKSRWNGNVDELLIIDAARAGGLVHGRAGGILAGVQEGLCDTVDTVKVVTLDGDGEFTTSLECVRRYVRCTEPRRVLVAAVNDSSALGAAHAFQEAGRGAHCAIVGQNAGPDARAELRAGRTPLIGSVAYFPERYGAELIALSFDILAGRPTPPAKFVKHQVITAANLDQFYPSDVVMAGAASSGSA